MNSIPTLKYRNIKTEIDGIRFDSRKEAKRYAELKLLVKAGQIQDLRLQVDYQVVEPVTINGKRERAIVYRADFVYLENGKPVCEDVKGVRTDVYRIKRRLMKLVHGIEIRET